MDRKNILAHRGLWTEPHQKNTFAALKQALLQGFGIETDFRDSAGQLFVSHDPVGRDDTLLADAFFADYASQGVNSRLALNIKADGLSGQLGPALQAAAIPLENVYAFDMSVPDTLGYIARNFPVYTRLSEYEPDPAFMDSACGVWIDNFSGEFPQVSKAKHYLDAGYRVALVSPELHGRAPDALWQELLEAGLHHHPLFELCTDFPVRASDLLGTK